jgi:hypothetical protein
MDMNTMMSMFGGGQGNGMDMNGMGNMLGGLFRNPLITGLLTLLFAVLHVSPMGQKPPA